MNTMVDQLMPPEDSDAPYQKVLWPGQVQGIPYGPAIVHTDTEYQHQHQCAAAQRHPLAGDAVQHDQQEHDDKNYQRYQFSYHRKFASF